MPDIPPIDFNRIASSVASPEVTASARLDAIAALSTLASTLAVSLTDRAAATRAEAVLPDALDRARRALSAVGAHLAERASPRLAATIVVPAEAGSVLVRRQDGLILVMTANATEAGNPPVAMTGEQCDSLILALADAIKGTPA
jgi:hypothetical protein